MSSLDFHASPAGYLDIASAAAIVLPQPGFTSGDRSAESVHYEHPQISAVRNGF